MTIKDKNYHRALREFCNEHAHDLTRNNRIWYQKTRDGWVYARGLNRLLLRKLKKYGLSRYIYLGWLRHDAAQVLKYGHEVQR